jgi:hypothetical protein
VQRTLPRALGLAGPLLIGCLLGLGHGPILPH